MAIGGEDGFPER